MSNTIGYLIASDFVGGTLVADLRPALVMIKAGNCKFCRITEPAFKSLASRRRDFNLFYMRPFDGRDPRERDTRQILFDIVETEDFGFPTFVYVKPNGQKTVRVGSMSADDMLDFVRLAARDDPPAVSAPQAPPAPPVMTFKPYNA